MEQAFVTKLESLHAALFAVKNPRLRESIKRVALSKSSLRSHNVQELSHLLQLLEDSTQNDLTKSQWLEFMRKNTLIPINIYQQLELTV